MTNDAPERIWAWKHVSDDGAIHRMTGLPIWAPTSEVDTPARGATEYIRADLALQWQGIESAPRDGTSVLLWLEEAPHRPGFACIGFWGCTNATHLISSNAVCDESCTKDWQTGYLISPGPTRWAPILPPKEG